MTPLKLLEQRGATLFRWFILFLLLLGIVLRIIVWFQNRNLVIDEANVARNIFECNFQQLTQPLKYEQYAPPIFLWMEKTASLVFGFSEQSMRLYPLLCGIGALFALYKITHRLMPDSGAWLTIAVFSLGAIYVEYSATLKQYMPDAFIGLVLIWLALTTDYKQVSKGRFALTWLIAGSLAIWSSMPSVFILAGIGAYYALLLFKDRKAGWLLPSLLVVAIWLLQFMVYYFTILKPQAESAYLQNFHKDFFLHALPASKEEWAHNGERLYDLIGNMGGWTTIAMVSYILFLLTGLVQLARHDKPRFLLLAVPIAGVLFAAALHKFSLIERVVMFMYPLMLLLVGYGFSQLWKLRYAAVRFVIFTAAMISVIGYARFPLYFNHNRLAYELTEGLDHLQQQGAHGNQLFVPGGSTATYVYYTSIHPDHQKYATLTGAYLLGWQDDYAAAVSNRQDTTWFIYSENFQEPERNKRTAEIAQHLQQFSYFERYNSFVYGYVPKQ